MYSKAKGREDRSFCYSSVSPSPQPTPEEPQDIKYRLCVAVLHKTCFTPQKFFKMGQREIITNFWLNHQSNMNVFACDQNILKFVNCSNFCFMKFNKTVFFKLLPLTVNTQKRGFTTVCWYWHPVLETCRWYLVFFEKVQLHPDCCNGTRTRRTSYWVVQSLCSASLLWSNWNKFWSHVNEYDTYQEKVFQGMYVVFVAISVFLQLLIPVLFEIQLGQYFSKTFFL